MLKAGSLSCGEMKPGDYVEVKPGVHDDRMPLGRRDGLVVEVTGQQRDQVIIMFHNKAFLKFHISQVSFVKNIFLCV